MHGTCSAQAAEVVKELGANPIDYRNSDFVQEVHRLTGDGGDAVFDGIGGTIYGALSKHSVKRAAWWSTDSSASCMEEGWLRALPNGRHPIRESAILGWYILQNWLLPGRKSTVAYSIQWLMQLKPAWFRHDLLTLFELLQQQKIKPLIAQPLPLCHARQAHELLGRGGVIGKIVLTPKG